MNEVNGPFALSLLVVLCGYAAKRLMLVTEKEGEALSRVILNITLPALILHTFSGIPMDYSLALLPLLCVAYSALILLITFMIFKKEPGKKRGILTISSLGFNIGLFAFPLVEAAWGKEGLKYMAMFDMGNAFIIFVLCYVLAGHFSSEKNRADLWGITKQLVTFVPLLGYVAALVISLQGIALPEMVLGIFALLARANGPLVLLLLGIYLNFSLERHHWKDLAKVLSIRYGAGIIAGAGLYLLLPFGELFRVTVLIALVLPVGMAIIPFAIQFHYDRKLVGAMVNFSNIVSFALVWLITAAVRI